ncbi:MAG: DUF1573 domain-containing protein [Planctomycetes bacterium]|nr:DUF1573 domain-containing protein [Planctomycetota bacterium]
MRKALLTVLLVAVALQTAHAREVIIGGPKIEYDEQKHDFGAIPQHVEVEHTFTFRNAGDETLKILNVHSSCGCTVAKLDENEKEIAPGKTGKVEVKFNSQTFNGIVNKTVTLTTNDPASPKVIFKVTANVLADMVCSPLHVKFNLINPNERPERSVKVFSPRNKKFKITSVKTTLDYIHAEVVEPEEGNDGDDYVIKVSINGTPPSGAFSGSVLISTDLHEKNAMSVTVSGKVRSRTDVTPRKIFFGIVREGDSPSRALVIRANSWQDLKVEKVDAPEGLSVTTDEIIEGKEWRVSVQFNGPFDRIRYSEKIRIHINDPGMKVIELGVGAICRKKK